MGCAGSRSKEWETEEKDEQEAAELQVGLLRAEEAKVEDESADGHGGGALPSCRRRVYYIDWMRVVAIYFVVAYHVVQALDWVHFYDHVLGMKRFVIAFRATALQVGMPTFFHICGRAQALSPTVGFMKTLLRRTQRLILPFIVCYTLLVPPWQYIDKEYDWNDPSSFHMKVNPMKWLLEYYTTSRFLLYFDLVWLWFLPALFAIGVFTTPLFLLAERYKGPRMQRTYSIVTTVLWVGLLLGLVWGCGFSRRFGFFAVMGPASLALIAQVAPLPPREGGGGGSPLRSWLAVRVGTVAQIIASVGLVLSFAYAEIDPPRADGGHDPRAAVPFLVLCLGFYVHGYFVQRWSYGEGDLDGTRPPAWVGFYRLCAAFLIMLSLMVSSPQGDVETGHFIYPVYSTSYKYGPEFGAVHVLGTWCYLGIFVALFQAYGEDVITKRFYRHATGSTIVIYIFHWVFVKVFAFWMLTPTLFREGIVVTNIWAAVGMTLMALFFSVSCSLLVYGMLLGCPRLGRLFGI